MTSAPSPKTCWVVAHLTEAKPLIQALRLRARTPSKPFRVYQDKAEEHFLIISGNGKVACAAATQSLYHLSNANESSLWINFGTAGARDEEIGALHWAHQITDSTSGRSWYPPMLLPPRCPTSQMYCLEQEENVYPENGCCDMESAAFMQTASRFATAELVQVLKMVSDNAKSPFSMERTEREMPNWVKSYWPTVLDLHAHWKSLGQTLANELEDPPGYQDCLHHWRFSVSEQHQLRKLLRSQANHNKQAFDLQAYQSEPSTKALLNRLRAEGEKVILSL